MTVGKLRWLLAIGVVLLLSRVIFAQGTPEILGIIRGDSLGSQFGKKVVPAGDVNGDTIPDFLVLATGDQKVYLYHGKKGGLDTLPDLFFEHKSQLDLLGDLNGDSGCDFAMRESGQNYRFSIYFGGLCLDTLLDGLIKGESTGIFGDVFGGGISAGKLNNSENTQIAGGRTRRGFDSSRFYFYNTIQNIIDSIAFSTWDFENRIGVQAGPAQVLGDINGNGFADLAISRTTRTDTEKGEVEIYLGGPGFDSIPEVIIRPPPSLTGITAGNFGSNLAPVGDLNNDGFAEFVVGAGRTPLLYFGSSLLDTLPRFTLDRLGDHFVSGRDINADGYNDLLVGRDEFPITGFAYVYYGGPTMDSVRDLEIRELDLPFLARGFGQTVAGLGDIDGNGSNDFAVGSTSNTDPDRGYLWVFNGLLPSTGIDEEELNLPKTFTLEQNYPNPFNSSTVIQYSLSKRTIVTLEVFNIAGQRVKVLVNREQTAGSHEVRWDGTDSVGKVVPSGVYLYRLKTGVNSETKKMVFL